VKSAATENDQVKDQRGDSSRTSFGDGINGDGTRDLRTGTTGLQHSISTLSPAAGPWEAEHRQSLCRPSAPPKLFLVPKVKPPPARPYFYPEEIAQSIMATSTGPTTTSNSTSALDWISTTRQHSVLKKEESAQELSDSCRRTKMAAVSRPKTGSPYALGLITSSRWDTD